MASIDVVICPECGGIIGATKATDQGKPCTCFLEKPAADPADGEFGPKKVCCQCGIDLTGRKRYHDSVGYWCPECLKADEKAKNIEGVPCADCGRRVRESALIDYEGRRICYTCKKDLVQIAKQKLKFRPGVTSEAFNIHERKRMLIVSGILVVLLAIIVLSRLHVLGRMF